MGSACIAPGVGERSSPASTSADAPTADKADFTLRRAAQLASACPERSRAAPAETVDHHGPVAVLRLVSSAAAFWSSAGMETFNARLSALAGRPDVAAIVLYGDAVFEDASPEDMDLAASLIGAVAGCSVPVFAALETDAIGVGLELALACKGRVAKEGARFALPAVLAGRLPALGGIQRLQALADVDDAARMIVFGETFDASTALRCGLIDGVVARGVARFAVALAQSCDRGAAASAARPHSISADLPKVRYEIAHRARGQAAPLAAVHAMEAVMRLPPRRAAVEIQQIADRLSGSEQGQALQHATASEAALTRPETVQSLSLTELAAQLAWPMRREAIHALDEGATPAQVDRCLGKYGFERLPFEDADRLGLTAVFSASDPDGAEGRAWPTYSPTLDFMLEAGRAGGAQPGWYRSGEAEALRFDPEVERILTASALFQRLQRRRTSDEAIEHRLFHAMIGGCLAVLEAHPPLRWTDIDALWTTRLGFPRWRGGPLFQGAALGWGEVRTVMERPEFRRTMGEPSALLKQWERGAGSPPRLDEGRASACDPPARLNGTRAR